MSIKLLLPAPVPFHRRRFLSSSLSCVSAPRAVHTCCVSLRRACVWSRSIDASSRSIIARSPPRTHSIPSLQGMERTAWLRVHVSPRTKARSLEHGNQLPDDHCHGRHACVCIASHIEKLLDERHNMYTVKEQTDRKQKVVRDIIIIRRHVVDQQLLDDPEQPSLLLHSPLSSSSVDARSCAIDGSRGLMTGATPPSPVRP